MREYDLIAEWYASERVDDTGVAEALTVAESVRAPGRILDIGCGNGIPITHALLAAGRDVVAFDSSNEMVKRFRQNCPTTPVVRGMAQACPFDSGTFDGAVAWGVMFHLPPDDEIAMSESVARILRPGAPFLFTAGYGEVNQRNDPHVGVMHNVQFPYYAFSTDGYRRILNDHGFTFIDFHTDSGQNGYYLAAKLR